MLAIPGFPVLEHTFKPHTGAIQGHCCQVHLPYTWRPRTPREQKAVTSLLPPCLEAGTAVASTTFHKSKQVTKPAQIQGKETQASCLDEMRDLHMREWEELLVAILKPPTTGTYSSAWHPESPPYMEATFTAEETEVPQLQRLFLRSHGR